MRFTVSPFRRQSPLRRAVARLVAVLALTGPVWADQTEFSFTPPSTIQFPTGQFPSHVAVGDLNNDGNVDLFVTGRNNDGRMFTVSGNGDGTFGPQQEIIIGSQTDWAALADLNGNGFLDVAVAVRAHHGRVAVLLNDGAAASAVPSSDFHVPTNRPSQLGARNSELRSAGNFAEPDFYVTGRLVQGVVASDFTGDGRIDLLSVNTNSGHVRVLHNVGGGQFNVLAPLPVAEWVSGHPNPNHAIVADFTGDGRADLAVNALGSGRINVAHGAGLAVFSSPVGYRAPPHPVEGTWGSSNSVAADMTGNGRLDLVVPMASLGGGQYFGVWENDGQGRFTPPQLFIGAFGGLAWHTAIGDFDGDGRPDVVVSFAISSKLSFHRNITESSTLAFAERQELSVGQFVRTMVPVDVNNNGVVDLVHTDYSTHAIKVRLNTTPQAGADGGQRSEIRDHVSDSDDSEVGLDLSHLLAEVGDLNDDGRVDVLDLLIALDSLGEEPLP